MFLKKIWIPYANAFLYYSTYTLSIVYFECTKELFEIQSCMILYFASNFYLNKIIQNADYTIYVWKTLKIIDTLITVYNKIYSTPLRQNIYNKYKNWEEGVGGWEVEKEVL